MLNLTDFTIDELAQQYNYMQWRIETKRKNPSCAWSLIHCKKEQADIYKTMWDKIPDTHLEEITALVKHANSSHITIEGRYRYNLMPQYTITIAYQTKSGFYKCFMYKHSHYVDEFTFTGRQITRYFTKLL